MSSLLRGPGDFIRKSSCNCPKCKNTLDLSSVKRSISFSEDRKGVAVRVSVCEFCQASSPFKDFLQTLKSREVPVVSGGGLGDLMDLDQGVAGLKFESSQDGSMQDIKEERKVRSLWFLFLCVASS
jgi:hypothetical protein